MIDMEHRANLYIFSLILLLSISACGSAPPRKPAALDRAKKTEQAAYRAMREGDLPRARELFGQARLMQQALENSTEASLDAINLATVEHRLGSDAAALQELEPILVDANHLVPEEMKASAAFRKAVILFDAGRVQEASGSLELANKYCNKDCPLQPGLKNLQARIFLQQGKFADAITLASQLFNVTDIPEEQANAYRTAGKAELALDKLDIALQHFDVALQLDKSLALSARIAEDLEGSASALQKMGKSEMAAIYTQRAADVRNALKQIRGSSASKPVY